MLDVILGIASSSGLGAIVGLVGSWLAKREQRKLELQRNDHEHAMAQIDLEERRLDRAHALDMADKDMEIAETEGAIATELAETDAFTESLKSQSVMTGSIVLDGIRTLMRPLITTYLLVVSTYIAYALHQVLGGMEVIPAADLYALYKHIIDQAVFLTVTAVLWWFGSRK